MVTGDAVWADAVPNLLIGLREGLEGGLVVSILLAAVTRTDDTASRRPVWLGVLAAVLLSLGFGAVLTFSRSALSTRAQAGFGGVLSVVAVVLVTVMIFWMRRTARTMSGELNARVDVALKLGVGALAATAFLAVSREGLETALFLWTAVQASGQTVGPLIGAGVGVGVAVGLCWLLYRRAIRINLGVFFSRTAIALVVIAGGVLAYGLGELQGASLLPGRTWLAFDLTGTIAADSWWVSIIRGITNLTPAMTWLQVVAFVVYIAVVLVAFRTAVKPAVPRTNPTWIPATVRQNRWLSIGAAVLVPLLAAGAFALFTAGTAAGSSDTVSVTASACAPEFTALATGDRTFTVVNKSGRGGEVYLVQSNGGGVVGELDSIGPGTRETMTVTVAAGSYAWRCQMSGAPVRMSTAVRTSGGSAVAYPRMFAVPPLQPSELAVPIKQYQTYVAGALVTLTSQAGTLGAAINAGNLDAARAAWLPAQLTWERVGAAYGSFGDLADAIDGDPRGRPLGVDDPTFTGLRRLEYGLWHGQSADTLAPIATRLGQDIATLQQKLPSLTVSPRDMPVRAHEILEDALRDHLSGMTDQGAGTGFAETLADVDGTRVVLGELESLIDQRKPGLVNAITPELDTLRNALLATEHNGVFDNETTGPITQRQRVNAAIGQVLETISPIPDLLEVGAS